MTTERTERAFVDDDTQDAFARFFTRVLETASPESRTQPSQDKTPFQRKPRNYETLTEFFNTYESGGVVADLTDKRSYMTYGTGINFETGSTLTDGQGRTVDQWLADKLGDTIDYQQIQWGIHSYVTGNAWVEIVESRDGSFSHLETIDPTTIDPSWNRHGQIETIKQYWKPDGHSQFESVKLDPANIASLSYKTTPGGPVESGLYDRNWDLVQRYAKNQKQRKNAIRLHGSPHYHVQVGSESQSIPDKLLRRVRDRFSSERTDEKTNWVTGGDISVRELDAPGFEGMSQITETDMAQLAQGFGLPLELTNFGSDGLGSGKPADVRWQAFERQARAEQKLRVAQMMRQLIRPILQRYSPYPEDIDVEIRFGDVVSDQQAAAEWMRDFKSYMQPTEVRDRLDLVEDVDESELGPPEGTPDAEQPGGEGGLFATVPSNEAPDPLDKQTKRVHTDGGKGCGTDFRDTTGRQLLHADADPDQLTQEELIWSDVFERVIWSDNTDRQLFEFDPEEVPKFVVERLETAVENGALFEDFETIPPWAASNVEDVLLDSLETSHGWSVDSIANNLQDMALGLSQTEAEMIARTETASFVNSAREIGYREEFGDDALFKWVGPSNDRTTDACEWLKEKTNPKFGGEPVSLDRLKELIQEAPKHDDDMPDDLAREFVVHPNERHTFVRVVE